MTELMPLQLRVKEGLDEEVFPHAVKALWWVEQFLRTVTFGLNMVFW
ncbi:hypothetical protein P7H16_08180 [Paenibacillus larvae]|nr:hypothetical protein [Paenibacillus larvae]MDT2246914.1 hypothetical protein [Paenibacillus larvae]